MPRETPYRVIRRVQIGDGEFRLLNGDICFVDAEAVVNAANSGLAHGGGVAAAIARRGGPQVQAESAESVRRLGPVPVGEARSTGAGTLPMKRVVHAVGPRWGEGDEPVKLRRAVTSALEVARAEGLSSIVLPAISTGIFGFPKVEASEIIVDACEAFLRGKPGSVRRVDICVYDDPTFFAFDGTWTRRYGMNLPG